MTLDATLIATCEEVKQTDAAFHTAWANDDHAEAEALAERRRGLALRILATRAVTTEGISAKAGIVALLHDQDADDLRSPLIASLLADAGATVPPGFA